MNCFQFDYFCGYHTALKERNSPQGELWIAFNLITFVDITQRMNAPFITTNSCELLSIWLLLWISHSGVFITFIPKHVVNCFQFDYFCGYHTASNGKTRLIFMLWIAFNLITFVDITQPSAYILSLIHCCELLSIWLLLWISHSK